MSHSLRSVFMLVSVLFLSVGCSIGCSAVQKPTATVRGASLGQVTPEGMTLNLDLLLSNPNSVAIPLTKTGYTLAVADTKILTGSADPKTVLPANGSAPLTLPVAIRWEDLLKAESALVSSGGDVPYTLNANLALNTSGIPFIGEQSIPLSYSGKLPLKQALRDPQALMRSPAARALAKKVLGSSLPF